MSATDYVIIHTTTDTEANAKLISFKLVKLRLAACVTYTSQARSYYLWRGKLEDETEFIISIKTRQHFVKEVEEILTDLHNYSVPQFLVTPIIGISEDYRNWMEDSLE